MLTRVLLKCWNSGATPLGVSSGIEQYRHRLPKLKIWPSAPLSTFQNKRIKYGKGALLFLCFECYATVPKVISQLWRPVVLPLNLHYKVVYLIFKKHLDFISNLRSNDRPQESQMHFTVSSIYFSSEGIVCVFDKNCLLVSSSYSVISMGEVFSRFTVKGAIVRLRSTLFTYETHNSMFTTATPLDHD